MAGRSGQRHSPHSLSFVPRNDFLHGLCPRRQLLPALWPGSYPPGAGIGRVETHQRAANDPPGRQIQIRCQWRKTVVFPASGFRKRTGKNRSRIAGGLQPDPTRRNKKTDANERYLRANRHHRRTVGKSRSGRRRRHPPGPAPLNRNRHTIHTQPAVTRCPAVQPPSHGRSLIPLI